MELLDDAAQTPNFKSGFVGHTLYSITHERIISSLNPFGPHEYDYKAVSDSMRDSLKPTAESRFSSHWKDQVTCHRDDPIIKRVLYDLLTIPNMVATLVFADNMASTDYAEAMRTAKHLKNVLEKQEQYPENAPRIFIYCGAALYKTKEEISGKNRFRKTHYYFPYLQFCNSEGIIPRDEDIVMPKLVLKTKQWFGWVYVPHSDRVSSLGHNEEEYDDARISSHDIRIAQDNE